jgi:putative DNA primase/helicase
MPVVNARGRAISCIENVIECARRLGVVVRYNVISKEEELLIPGQGFSVDNGANASLAWFVSEAAKMQLPLDRIPDYLCYLADQNQYNPVAEWITSRAWDGQDRLSALIGTIRAVDESDPGIAAMKRAFITRWMISAVAAAFRPSGVSAHGVLVLQGPQYLGKTRWFKRLAPEHLGVLKDGLLLRPDDRDSVMRCVSHWLVELGEIDATFRRADVAALKSFLTSDRDVLRRAYARKESTYARRTVFFASVNPTHYLHDESGNRRYWTVACEHIDHDHDIDMQQVWAQVYESLYQRGESWFLTPEEFAALNEHNADFQVADPIEDLITHGLRWDQPRDLWDWRTATDVLTDLGRKNCAKADVTRAGILIRGLNGNSSRRTAVARLLLVPSLR